MLDTTPLHPRYVPATFLMPASCIPVFARMPVHSSGLVSEGQPTFRIDASRHTARLARGVAPSNPGKPKDILRFNAALHGMSMSDYIRQTCLGIRLRKTPEEKRRLRELSRIGANINQLVRWANTYKRAAEAVEVLTALAGIEQRIIEFASCASTEDEPEAKPC